MLAFMTCSMCSFLLFIKLPATTEIYTLSLHDALPIYGVLPFAGCPGAGALRSERGRRAAGGSRSRRELRSPAGDRKSTRLNSSHTVISYAVFCLKKKNHTKHWHLDQTPRIRRQRTGEC